MWVTWPYRLLPASEKCWPVQGQDKFKFVIVDHNTLNISDYFRLSNIDCFNWWEQIIKNLFLDIFHLSSLQTWLYDLVLLESISYLIWNQCGLSIELFCPGTQEFLNFSFYCSESFRWQSWLPWPLEHVMGISTWLGWNTCFMFLTLMLAGSTTLENHLSSLS